VSFFSKLFADKDPMPEVREDDTLGDAGTRAVQELAGRGDWRRIREALAGASNPQRWRYANAAADGLGDRVGEWTEAEAEDGDAWLVAGLEAIDRGASIRGEAKADETPEEAWDPFHDCMNEAEEYLRHAIELRPDDPLPWIPLLTTSTTLGAPIEDRRALFEEARRRDPRLSAPHLGLMNALTLKWGGSHDLMFEAARSSVKSAPAGTAIPAVLALAHVERWLYIVHWEKDQKASRAYFARPEVQREVQDCHGRCQGVDGTTAVWVANVFAFCFYLGGDAARARREFEKAGGVFSGHPWRYLGDVDAYRRAMKSVWR
jgi:hypothetical protein